MLTEWAKKLLALRLVVVALAVSPALAQGGDAARKTTIEADGHGEVRAKLDMARISLTIDTRRDTVDDAMKANAATVASVTRALKPELGAEGDHVRTVSMSTNPQYATSVQTVSEFQASRRFDVIVSSSNLVYVGELTKVALAEEGTRFAGTDSESPGGGKIRVIIDVTSTASAPDEAAKINESRARKVLHALQSKMDGQGTIETAEDRLGPAPSAANPPRPVIDGYSAHSNIEIVVDTIDLVGGLTDKALKAGASRLNSITFELRDPHGAEAEAIAVATKDAEFKAQAQAAALGVKLGPLLKSAIPQSSSEPWVPLPIPGAATAPIQPGEVTVSSNVTLTYETL